MDLSKKLNNLRQKTPKAPFPYFGGKMTVAKKVWAALGHPAHYLEPFFGSGAVLLARQVWGIRYTETVNDANGHICNVWRSIKFSPEETAHWCDWPVNHADLMARKKMLNAATGDLLKRLVKNDKWHNSVLAGYWIWAASCWIGHGLISPGAIPNLGSKGKGVHARGKQHGVYDWFEQLAARLRYVRVVCGDWSRICGGDWQDSNWPTVGIFFDPPYGHAATRGSNLYAVDSLDVADAVRGWCLQRGSRSNYRIVLAGYYEEHASLLEHGWRCERWSAGGGYGKIARNGAESRGQKNRHREALFFSPHCCKIGVIGG